MVSVKADSSGVSVRVPVNNVSMVDLTVRLETPVASKEELLKPIREASTGLSSLGPLNNVLCVNDDELVSHDFLGWQHSCIVDSAATVMLNDRVFKIIAWYGEFRWALSRIYTDACFRQRIRIRMPFAGPCALYPRVR